MTLHTPRRDSTSGTLVRLHCPRNICDLKPAYGLVFEEFTRGYGYWAFGGITAPRVVKDEKPKYTAAAMQEKIAGTVLMDVVVNADGKVGAVRVTKSLDREFGLDDQAIAAVKNWQFKPGTKDDVAVPVLVVIEMTFALKK